MHRELWNSHPRTRRLGFPWNSPRGASRPRPALHEWHQMLAQVSSGERSIPAPTAESAHDLQRAATCFPRNHEERRHVRTPLPQGCTQLWTTTLRRRSAVHRVVHNGGQAPLSTLACTDGTRSSPGTSATGAGEGAAEGRGRQVRPHRVHRTELTHIASMADPCVLCRRSH